MENIFVGNLSFAATKEDVRKLFEKFGTVASVVIVKGKKQKPRGFCFVDMPDEEQLKAALNGLDGKNFMDRPLKVNRVNPNEKSKPHSSHFKPVEKPWGKNKQREFKPYRQEDRESKPWDKSKDSSRPYRRDDRESKPWDKNKGSSDPFTKFSESKPWVKKAGGPRSHRDDQKSKPWEYKKTSSKPFNKYGGRSSGKPWEKKDGESRPRQDDRDSKPWDKNKGSAKPFNKFPRRPRSE